MKSGALKKSLIILSCIAILLSAVVLLVFYFVKNPSNNDKNPLAVSDMVLFEGEQQQIDFNSPGGDVLFSSVDNTIAEIVDNDFVKGISVGVTLLKAEVQIGDKTYTQTAQVKVLKKIDEQEPALPVYSVQLVDLQNCEFAQNQLNIFGSATFAIQLFEDGSQLDYEKLSIWADEGIDAKYYLNFVTVDAVNDGNIAFHFDQLDFKFVLSVHLAN